MSDDNGTNPAAPKQDAAEQVPVSERLMGAIGLIIAVGLAAIAVDLMTGGAISRMFGGSGDDESG